MTGRTISDVYGSVNSSMSFIGTYLDSILGLAEENSARSQSYARQEMDFNSLEAAKNRNWQEFMSNTAHQREVADLQAAGLNPVLSASGGNGAAVTSGATASGSSGSVDNGATSAMVSLLNNAINADVSLEAQKNSALTSLAVAEKQAESAATVQSLANDNSFKEAVLASDTSKAINAINAAVSSENSKRSYNASVYGANKAYSQALDVLEKSQHFQLDHPNNPFTVLTSNPITNTAKNIIDNIKDNGVVGYAKSLFNSVKDYIGDKTSPTFHFSTDPVNDAKSFKMSGYHQK